MRAKLFSSLIACVILCFAALSAHSSSPLYFHWITQDKVVLWRSLADDKPITATRSGERWQLPPDIAQGKPWASPSDDVADWDSVLSRLSFERQETDWAKPRFPDAEIYVRKQPDGSRLVSFLKDGTLDMRVFKKRPGDIWRKSGSVDLTGFFNLRDDTQLLNVIGSVPANNKDWEQAWNKWIESLETQPEPVHKIQYRDSNNELRWMWLQVLDEEAWVQRMQRQMPPTPSFKQENGRIVVYLESSSPIYKRWWLTGLIGLLIGAVVARRMPRPSGKSWRERTGIDEGKSESTAELEADHEATLKSSGTTVGRPQRRRPKSQKKVPTHQRVTPNEPLDEIDVQSGMVRKITSPVRSIAEWLASKRGLSREPEVSIRDGEQGPTPRQASDLDELRKILVTIQTLDSYLSEQQSMNQTLTLYLSGQKTMSSTLEQYFAGQEFMKDRFNRFLDDHGKMDDNIARVLDGVKSDRELIKELTGMKGFTHQDVRELIQIGRAAEFCYGKLLTEDRSQSNAQDIISWFGVLPQAIQNLKGKEKSLLQQVENKNLEIDGLNKRLMSLQVEKDSEGASIGNELSRRDEEIESLKREKVRVENICTLLEKERAGLIEASREAQERLERAKSEARESVTKLRELELIGGFTSHLQQGQGYYFDAHKDAARAGVLSFLINYSLFHLCLGIVRGEEVRKKAMISNLYAISTKLTDFHGFTQAQKEISSSISSLNISGEPLPTSQLKHFDDEMFQVSLQYMRSFARLDLAPFYFDIDKAGSVHRAN